MQNVLVTGANGFIGKALCDHLSTHSVLVRGAVRSLPNDKKNIDYCIVDFEKDLDLSGLCHGVDCIVHLAGRAHVLNDRHHDPQQAFRTINCEASFRLARQAVRSGVKRFIFLSSIGVNGSQTPSCPFDESSVANPMTPYARSKLEAEQGLEEIFRSTDSELVIIRPPLVYGLDAPGNFSRLLKLIRLPVPLPLGRIRNLRSLVSLENMVEFIRLCLGHPGAVGRVFLISDGVDVSTSEIVSALSEGMARKKFLFHVPNFIFKAVAKLVDRENLYTQLFCSLQVDTSLARRLLGWTPLGHPYANLRDIGRQYRDRYSA